MRATSGFRICASRAKSAHRSHQPWSDSHFRRITIATSGPRAGIGAERLESDVRTQLVDAIRIGESLRARDSIPRIIDPLRAVPLRPALEECDAVGSFGTDEFFSGPTVPGNPYP
jgi:hypothetical protein